MSPDHKTNDALQQAVAMTRAGSTPEAPTAESHAAGAGDRAAAQGGACISRRTFLRAAGVGIAAAATGSATLAGCTSAGLRATPRAGQKAQLVYQDWNTKWFPPMVQQALEEFQASHPNIRVFYVPDPENPSYEEKVLADMQAGRMADVFEGCCTQFPTWAQENYTLDLRKYVEADLDRETIADWDLAQYRAFFTPDGKQFGLPKYHGALALYYNKDLFRQVGVDFPDGSWNHDDYLEAMRRVSYSPLRWGSMLETIWERVQVHVNAWGGHFVDPSNPRKSGLADPATLAALQWLRDRIWKDHFMPERAEVQSMGTREAFVAGKVAMVEDGSWALKDVLTEAQFDVGVAPMPAGPAGPATLATTDGFGIYGRTKNPDAAWELVKFLISKEYGRYMAKAAFLQPARASLVDEWIGFIRADFPTKARDVDIAAFADGHRRGYSVTPEIFANMADAKRLVSDAFDRIFTFGDTSVEHMIDVSAQVEATQQPG